jgi:hypothetical protein
MSRREWVAFLEIKYHPSAACATLRPCAGFGPRLLLKVYDAGTDLVSITSSIVIHTAQVTRQIGHV